MAKGKRKSMTGAHSPAARAKRKATFAAKRAEREAQREGDAYVSKRAVGGAAVWPAAEAHAAKRTRKDADPHRDVVIFLEKAELAILKSGGKRISPAETYAMLALTTLRGH